VSPAERPTGAHNWPQYRYAAQNTGYHPKTTAPRENVGRLWHRQIPDPVLSTPIAVDGVVYVGTQDGYHLALNAVTGEDIWQHTAISELYREPQIGSFAFRNGTVYTGTNNFYALDAVTGERTWVYRGTGTSGSGYVAGSPTLVDRSIYLAANGPKLLALDSQRGHARWTYATDAFTRSTPAVDEDVVVLTTPTGTVHAVDTTTHEPQWTFTARVQTGSPQTPVIRDGTVYFATDHSPLYALDLSDGSVKWTYDYYDGFGFGTPAVTTTAIYVRGGGAKQGTPHDLIELNPETGDRLWAWQSQQQSVVAYEHIVCTAETILARSGGAVHAHDAATGEKLWEGHIGMPASGLAVADGIVYVGGADGIVAFAEQ
jgi:outer membrane protein assembly factor BamB